MSDKIGRLSRLGFSSVPECLLVAPKGYRDCLEPLYILPIPDIGESYYMVLTLVGRELFDRQGQPTTSRKKAFRLSMRAVDGRGDAIPVTIFGNVWPWMELQPGDALHIYGEVTTWKERRQINNPELVPPPHRGKVVPLYVGKPGQVSADLIGKGVDAALPRVGEAACSLLEQAGMRERDFISVAGMMPESLLKNLHTPLSVREGESARKIAKTLSIEAILNRAKAASVRVPVSGAMIPIDYDLVAALSSALPYPLTADQKRSIGEIVSDLRSPFPMKRLLSGDVGTGKSVTFLVPAVAAYKSGAKVGIVVPSQLLVRQIASELRSFFPGVLVCEVVAGSKLQEGIAIGTTALLGAAKRSNVVFDLIITDEEHKFSVGQKEVLAASHTNLLSATATAIPRTLALVKFGGIDVSVLRECPVKKKITTRIVAVEEQKRLFGFLSNIVKDGFQFAIVYPLAEGTEDGDRYSVEQAYPRFEALWPGKVGMIHGKLTDEEKASVIQKMKDGAIKVLIASTVIEVGITLPSLKALVVVNPDRFGVSQLHQLRGRVARHGGDGFFFMLHTTAEVNEDVQARLTTLVECSDGFSLAERDADLRGFGEVDGDEESQAGASRLLFWGVKLMRKEIEDAANKGGSLAS